MVLRFYVERDTRRDDYANGSCVKDSADGSTVCECPEHATAEIVASMFNNRVRFNEPVYSLSKKDESYASH